MLLAASHSALACSLPGLWRTKAASHAERTDALEKLVLGDTMAASLLAMAAASGPAPRTDLPADPLACAWWLAELMGEERLAELRSLQPPGGDFMGVGLCAEDLLQMRRELMGALGAALARLDSRVD